LPETEGFQKNPLENSGKLSGIFDDNKNRNQKVADSHNRH